MYLQDAKALVHEFLLAFQVFFLNGKLLAGRLEFCPGCIDLMLLNGDLFAQLIQSVVDDVNFRLHGITLCLGDLEFGIRLGLRFFRLLQLIGQSILSSFQRVFLCRHDRHGK